MKNIIQLNLTALILYRDFRTGDERHSLANIGKAALLNGWRIQWIAEGLQDASGYYSHMLRRRR